MNAHTPTDNSKPWTTRFFTIWTAQAFSLLGSQLVSFAVIWWLTQTTGSATVLATASLVGLLPQVLLGPIAGTLVDRWNRRITLIIADGFIALATLALAILFATSLVQVWHVYFLLFIRATASGFHWTAMQASTTLMIPKEHYARIQGLNQTLHGGMSIASAPLGALLLAWLPMQGILAIDVVTALIAITPLFFFAIPQPVPAASQSVAQGNSSIWQDMRAGFRYVGSWPGLLIIGVMAALINFLLNPAFALLPILVTRHFNGQAIQLASIESFWGIGTITGGLILGAWGGFKRRVYTSMLGLIAMGVGCLAIGLLPATAFVFAVAAMFFIGVFNPIVNGPLMAAVQAAVAPEMQGRVFTLIVSLSGGMAPIGLIIAGPIADKLGVQTWFIIGGILTLLMGIGGFFIPAVVHFEDGRSAEQPADATRSIPPGLDEVSEPVAAAAGVPSAEIDFT